MYVIAEMACSHGGDPAIQFQVWALKDMMVPHHPDLHFLGCMDTPYEAESEHRHGRK